LSTANPPSANQLRCVLLHYWLISLRGGEKVLTEIARVLRPERCYAHLADPAVVSRLNLGCTVETSLFSRIPLARKLYKVLFALMYPAAFLLPTRDADLIVSSESGPIKGVRKRRGALHVCYCHSPFRILWAPARWYRPVLGPLWWLLPMLRWPLRWVDRLSARSVDVFVANSSYIRERIRHAYGRDAVVIHPPVDVQRFRPGGRKDDYFLWLGELVSYKRPDLVVSAFSRNGLPLKVVGSGEMLSHLQAHASPNVEFLERVADEAVPELLAGARALVFGGVEDFGIVFVEALASGTPVIACREGGVLDIVEDGQSGILFDEQTVEGLQMALEEFIGRESQFDPQQLASAAVRFRPERFREEFRALLDAELARRGMRLD
jgi:glycosyltransferase involved in cell wall biosynthesis